MSGTDQNGGGETVSTETTDRNIARDLLAVSRDNTFTLVAAGVAYYLFNSLLALLLFAFIGLVAVGRLGPAVETVGTLAEVDAGRAVSTLDSLVDAGGRRRAGIIAGGILGWSSFRLVQAVNVAFASIYDVRRKHSKARTIANSLVVFATIVLLVPLVLFAAGVLTVIADGRVVAALTVPLLFAALLVGLLPMYYRFPGGETTLRESLPGTAFAAAAWTACAVGFRLFLTVGESIRLYGAVGAVLLALSWLYAGGLMLLIGAALNVVLADRVDIDADQKGKH